MPTLAAIRARVMVKAHDTDNRKGSLGIVRTDHAIADACLQLGSQIPSPEAYLPSAFTISAGDTFALPTAAQTGYVSTTQYAGDIRIRLRSNNMFLTKRTVEELDAFREGQTSTSAPGVPSNYCLWEEMDNEVQGRCWPAAAASQACDLFVSLVPDDLRDASDMDAANVRFSRYGATALVFHAAALLVAELPQDELALRKLNGSVAKLWLDQARVLLYEEEVRKNNNESIGRTMRWVS